MQRRQLMWLGVCFTLVIGSITQATSQEIRVEAPTRIRGLLAALEDPEPEVAVKALGWLAGRELAEPGVRERLQAFTREPRMLELLRAKDWRIQRIAIDALGSLGGESAQAHTAWLVDCLRSQDVRQEAVEALGKLGAAASAQAPLVASLLQDKDADVRRAAVEALGKMGAAASSQEPLVASLLQDEDENLRGAAVEALVRMGGAAASAQTPLVARLLQDEDEYIRGAAVWGLGNMGAAAGAQAPLVARLLQDEDEYVRGKAVEALGKMGAAASAQAPLVASLLREKDDSLRWGAVEALGSMGAAASAQAPLVAGLLQDKNDGVRAAALESLVKMTAASAQASLTTRFLQEQDEEVRRAALAALGKMGAAASAQAPLVASLLRDTDDDIRRAAVQALGSMGAAASAHAPLVASLLQDTHDGVREAVVDALGEMGGAASAQAPLVARLLQDEDERIRLAAVVTLGKMGAAASAQAPLVAGLLQDRDEDIRRSVRSTLLSLDNLGLHPVAAILVAAEEDSANRASLLLLAHAAGGGDPTVERLLQWVGRKHEELPSRLTVDDARATLQSFNEFWPETKPYPTLRKHLAELIADVTLRARGQWESADLGLLVRHESLLRESHPKDADTVSAVMTALDAWRVLRRIGWTVAAHAGFWFLLLFFYPRSPQVQAFFFWNPWVRRITGFGYVGLLLTWVPFLRRRVLAPFDRLLLAEAQLERFSATTYFEGAEVFLPASGRRERLLRILPSLRGQVVLEGASGLGKSMFLKYLLAHSKRLTVFLPAERCKGGVLEAIQAKLEGHAKDATFLRSLIYSGALDIYIDGLNEVTADTRARIVQFVESNFHGNILLTTQPIEWTAPAMASRYVVQPLSDEQLVRFLESREPVLAEKAPVRGQAYLLACQRFVAEALSPEQPVELRQAHSEVLSNPMDLTVVAQMLSEERQPDLFHLRQQQYELMARDYREVHLDDFPLKAFSEEAYEMRCEDRGVIPEEKFGGELLRMEAAKMVVRQQWKSPDGKEQREWRFRHDKIQEFFIAQTFLGKDNRRASKHLKDSRFRGVYLLLALLLEPEQAQALRDMLVEHAAETRDHSVSDDFVTLLKKRQGAEKARGNRSRSVA